MTGTNRSPVVVCSTLLPYIRRRWCPNRPLQQGKELLNPCFFLLGQFTLTPEQSWIKFPGQQCVLKTLDHPVDDRNHHFDIEILAQFAELQTKTHKTHRAVRVLGNQEAIYLALQHQVGPIVPQQ